MRFEAENIGDLRFISLGDHTSSYSDTNSLTGDEINGEDGEQTKTNKKTLRIICANETELYQIDEENWTWKSTRL